MSWRTSSLHSNTKGPGANWFSVLVSRGMTIDQTAIAARQAIMTRMGSISGYAARTP